jgi:ATP-grasp domain
MRILVLHHHRFTALRYDEAFDHAVHDVTYAGTGNFLRNIPAGVRCATHEIGADGDVVEQLRDWMSTQPPFDRVIARHEYMILPAGQLRDAFGIPGMTGEQALRFRDKVVMKQAIAAAGLRTPRCVSASDLPVDAGWRGRTVLKPRSGSASEGITIFDTCAEAMAAARTRSQSEPGFAETYELEEFVEGDIWHIDGYLHQGVPVVIQPSRYINTCLDFERGRPLGSVQQQDETMARWTLQCLEALGVCTLSFHVEAIESADGPVFLEAAARCGGIYIVDIMALRHGTFLHALDMASDVEGGICERFRPGVADPRSFGGFVFPAHVHGGRPCRVEVDPALLENPPLVSYSMLPPDAETVRELTYRTDLMPLSGVVASTDPAALERWLRALFDQVRVHS